MPHCSMFLELGIDKYWNQPRYFKFHVKAFYQIITNYLINMTRLSPIFVQKKSFHVLFTFLFPSKINKTQIFLLFSWQNIGMLSNSFSIKWLRYDTVILEKNIALKSNLPSKNLSNISIAWGKLLPSNWITIHHD